MDATAKYLLITGAAKRVGAALAEHFAARGWNLVLHCHQSRHAATELADLLQKKYAVSVVIKQADLGDNAALDAFWNDLPPVSAIIHNAAMFERDTLATMDAHTLQQQLQVNFTAPLWLTRGFMKQLPAADTGSVTVLGDGVMGWSISPEFFSYSVSKQAWLGTLDVLAAACAPRARVNMIALAPTLPGAADTPEMFDRLAKQAPLQRTSSPEEVCHTAEYLLGAEGVTGQVISLAGGMGLQSRRPLA